MTNRRKGQSSELLIHTLPFTVVHGRVI